MKKCTRFHFEDVERGDVLILTKESGEKIEDTVYGHYRSHNFGPVIRDKAAEDFYLDDYNDIRVKEGTA